MDSITGILKGNKRNHSGVRLIDELMVDIVGGLIPGVLFNFSLMVCFVLPIFIYKYIHPHNYHNIKELLDDHVYLLGGHTPAIGGWFWFAAFLTFLILSYIAGHIFYRADINWVDKQDIKRRKEKKKKTAINEIHDRINNGKTIVEIILDILIEELKSLKTDEATINGLKSSSKDESLIKLLIYINDAINKIDRDDIKGIITDSNADTFDFEKSKKLLKCTLLILFPQSNYRDSIDLNIKKEASYESIINDTLSLTEKHIFYTYLKEVQEITKELSESSVDKTQIEHKNYINYIDIILACYLLLSLQNDSGCSQNNQQSDYPYFEFYKYLLKRNETDLLQYVDWSPAGARTKNKINRMKIDIQLDYPDAYAILNKNESHIRMASSSWYVSRVVFFLSIWVCAAIIFAQLVHLFAVKISIHDLNYYLSCFHKSFLEYAFKLLNELILDIPAALPPALLATLIYYMRHQIEEFIHYQRLREIFFTLYIFHKLNLKKQGQNSYLKQNRQLILLASKDFLCSKVNELCSIQTEFRNNNQNASEMVEQLKAPFYCIWEYYGFGSPDALSSEGYKPYWIVLFKNSPTHYLLNCIELLSSNKIPARKLQDRSNLKEALIKFYLLLIKSYKEQSIYSPGIIF